MVKAGSYLNDCNLNRTTEGLVRNFLRQPARDFHSNAINPSWGQTGAESSNFQLNVLVHLAFAGKQNNVLLTQPLTFTNGGIGVTTETSSQYPTTGDGQNSGPGACVSIQLSVPGRNPYQELPDTQLAMRMKTTKTAVPSCHGGEHHKHPNHD